MPRISQARKARLSVPKVGRPTRTGAISAPRRAARGPRTGLGQRRVAAHRAGLGDRVVARPAGAPGALATPPSTQSEPTAPLSESEVKPAAAAPPPAPKGLFDLPGWSGRGEDPRDASYWRNIAKLRFSAEQGYSKGLLEQEQADTGYNDALQTAIRGRALEQRGLGEQAIRSNLGNSGWLDRSEAEDTLEYTRERSAAQLSKTQEDAAREAARSAILQGYSLDAAAELGEAAARLADRKEEQAEGGEGLYEFEEGGGGSVGSVSSGYMQPGGHIRPWKPKKSKRPKGSGGTSYVSPKKNAAKAALSPRRRAR